jgi:CRISPR/Cas system-associated exonuclease Cas4 (RecB family)|tara:strand:- start:729 stop:1469 length:741 start_codon:yes stop_codon:yes gene_type:complete
MWKKYPLKNGIVVSYNDEQHMYYVNDKKVSSVTGICSRGLPKPNLTNWLVYTPLSEAKNLINNKLDNNEPLDRAELERIFKVAKEKTNKIKEDAGLVGSVVHGLIEDFLKGKSIPAQKDKSVVNCWNIFFEWWNKQDYTVIDLEKKIYCKKYNYAGTLDLVVKDKKKNLVLIDIKTSNHISFDYLLQLNAYRYAYEEETGQKIHSSFVVRLPKKDSTIEIKEVPLNKKLFNAFIGAKYIMETMEEN